ncbi:MAG TPA: T9SS type A sorting domain-containing protein [Lutibacter sp.]|nr:T9SS type A sorting domain-containing protein [Lutibacter sp.]
MKLKLTIILLITAIVSLLYFQNSDTNTISDAKTKHTAFIDNSPLQDNLKLARKERKANALPPNAYLEQEYLLEMNPTTGLTEPEKVFALQEQLENERSNNRSTPGETGNEWVERGPDNVPGRTRAMLYDPNDDTHKRVFAGGVTGGLWVIDDIENSSSVWQRVNLPENVTVSCITKDINADNTLYIGSGEPYQGHKGNGIWKSTDGGDNWFHVFGGSDGGTTFISDAVLTVNSPASIAIDYVAIKAGQFGIDIPSGGVTGNLVLANDAGAAEPTEGCNSFGATVSGNIAIIDRGSCNFTEKVKHAQNVNATAVIIVQSVAGFPFAMGGEDASINIPAVMISKADGDIIKNAMQNGTVNITLAPVAATLPVGVRLVPGKFVTNDIVTRDNNGTTEIYATITDARYHQGSYELLGGATGLFKSIDGGTSWSLINLPLTADGNPHPINDILIGADNKVWLGSINSTIYRKADDTLDGGGKVFMSTDGVTFTQKYALANGNRVEMAASATNANKMYLMIYTVNNTVELLKSTFAFNFPPSSISKPNDPLQTVASDFTNTQGWYDLAITVDPSNDNNLYVGGINIFKSTNSGLSWTKVSHYYGQTAPGSRVHVDQHNIIMHPTDPNKGLIGNDGGVWHVSNWSNAQSNSNAISSRGNGYNTTQFYKGAIGQSTTNEKFLAGAQDNGTIFINNASANINSSTSVGGGDGMYCFIDKDSQYMISSVYQNSYSKLDINGNYQYQIVNAQNEGSFVNVAELDDNLDILYSNAAIFNTTSNSWEAKITRFVLGTSSAVRTNLTDALLTRPVSAMRTSPFTTGSTTLFVGTDSGDILKVTNANGTPTWTDLTPEPYDVPFLGSISSINFGANENEIIVTFHNYGVVNIYFTEDGGTTWQNKEGDLPDLPVKDILMNPLVEGEVIIATDLGVWKTSNFNDSTPNWVRSDNGMQNVKVTSFDFRTADNTILASTYGRGLFTGQFTNTAGINDSTKNINKILVYPTVTSGIINLKSQENLDNSTIKVFDINGKQVYNTNIDINNSSKSITLNVNQGIYFVNITNNNLKESHKIIIK